MERQRANGEQRQISNAECITAKSMFGEDMEMVDDEETAKPISPSDLKLSEFV